MTTPDIFDYGVTYKTSAQVLPWPTQPQLDAVHIWGPIFQGAAPPPGPHLSQQDFRVLVLAARLPWEVDSHSYTGCDVYRYPLENQPEPVTKAMWDDIDRAVVRVEMILQGLYPEGVPPILIACEQGKNRSALVTAAVLHRVTGWSGKRCVEHIQKLSSRTFSNTCFADSVRERWPLTRPPLGKWVPK